MHSDGSSSESDVSVSSVESYDSINTDRQAGRRNSWESYSSVGTHRRTDRRDSVESNTSSITHRRVSRRDSVESVCTRPTDDAYVMVLQNRKGLYDDLRCVVSMKDLCDVTFLVGEKKTPVHGVRAIIASRSRIFYQLIISHEKNKRLLKEAQKSKLRKTFSKLSKLACSRQNDESPTKVPRTAGSKLFIPMETFDPETFQRFMNYIHCGSLAVDSNTVIGVMNAAYMFGFPEVQQACWDFAMGCAEREDNLSDLLQSSKLYCDHKLTRSLLAAMKSCASKFPDLLANHTFFDSTDVFPVEEEMQVT